jgi:hypothetical protein
VRTTSLNAMTLVTFGPAGSVYEIDRPRLGSGEMVMGLGGMGMSLLDGVMEDERAYAKTLSSWVQQVYEGQCDMQANPHLFSLPCVVFFPAKRVEIPGDHPLKIRPPHYKMYDHSQATKRKAFQISMTKADSKQYSWLMDMKIELPYITATLWQKPARKKIAWMLLVKNARVAQYTGSAHGLHTFYLVCQDVTEMMPKDFLEPPEHPGLKRFANLAK